MRRLHGHQVEQQPRPLAARQVGDRGLLLVEAQAELRQPRAARGLAGLGHGAADDLQRRVGGVHRLDLVLVEPADLDAAGRGACAPARRRQRAGDQLGEGRLAGAVDAQQADAVVDVEPQVQLPAGSAGRRSRPTAPSSRISGGASGRSGEGRVKGATRSSIIAGDRLQLGQPSSGATGPGWPCEALARKRSTKDCRWARSASCLARVGRLQAQLLGAPALEVVVAAGVEVELAVLAGAGCASHRVVQQLAVVADDDARCAGISSAAPPATARLPGRGSWSARRAAAGRARRTGRRPAPRASASRRRTRPSAGPGRRWRSPGPPGSRRRATGARSASISISRA